MKLVQEDELFGSKLEISTNKTVISSFWYSYQEGELYLDAAYQRPYVWTEKEQQLLLDSLFTGIPLGGISIAINKGDPERYLEIVDGKQRLTTIILFLSNKIPYTLSTGKKIYFDDIDPIAQKSFKQIHLSQHELTSKSGPLTEKQKMVYFYRNNFGGIKQEEDHRLRVLEMIEAA